MIGKLMMGTKAGGNPKSPYAVDISRDEPDLMRVQGEDGDFWVGCWVEGYGILNVYFPKSSVRPCTEEEKARYMGWGTFPRESKEPRPYKADDFAPSGPVETVAVEEKECAAKIHLSPLGDTVDCELKVHEGPHLYSFIGYADPDSDPDLKREPIQFSISWK